MIKFLKIFFAGAIWLTVFLPLMVPAKTSALSNTIAPASPAGGPRQVAVVTEFGETDFGQYVSKIMSWLVTIIASLGALMFVYAGYIYVTSQGNPEGITQAKDIIIATITSIILLFLIEVILVKTVGIKWQYL
jgi:hypothetical protein